MSTFAERLREERKRLGLTQAEFAAISGQKKQSQVRYESGERSPDGNFFSAIAKAGVDITYVLTGASETREIPKIMDGARAPEMEAFQEAIDATNDFWKQQSANAGQDDNPSENSEESVTDPSDFSLVRRFDIGLSAGPGLIPIENGEAENFAVSRNWLLRQGLSADLCGLVKVKGDSMVPTVPDEALVLVNASEMLVTNEGIFAFSRNGEAFIKRLVPVNFNDDGRAGSLVIISDNPAYPTETVTGKDLNEIRVVGRVRLMLADL